MELRKNQVKNKISYTDFRQLLQNELLERCRTNPNYSLRSFARSLKVEPSALSQILNGKRPLTEKMKLRLGTSLGISIDMLKKIPTAENVKNMKVGNFQRIGLDSFAVISDWYHYAIIELTYLKDFKPDTSWISKRLGITKSEANIAVERLFRLDLLKETETGTWKDTSENGMLTHLSPGVSSDAARKYQRQLLDLSKNAIQEVSLEKRNHTSATFCFDTQDMASAIKKIADFRRQFANEFQPKESAQEVYQIQISFFPLTKPNNETETS